MGIKTWNSLSKIVANLCECNELLKSIKNEEEIIYKFHSLDDMEFVFSKSYDAFKQIADEYKKVIESEDEDF